MRIEGCKKKARHLLIGKEVKGVDGAKEEEIPDVRTDFYQTPNSVIASLYLKKVDKERATISFTESAVDLDLPTADKKRYTKAFPLFGLIDPGESTYKIMGTKLELNLIKADGASWPVLRSDDRRTGEIYQVGKAGRA